MSIKFFFFSLRFPIKRTLSCVLCPHSKCFSPIPVLLSLVWTDWREGRSDLRSHSDRNWVEELCAVGMIVFLWCHCWSLLYLFFLNTVPVTLGSRIISVKPLYREILVSCLVGLIQFWSRKSCWVYCLPWFPSFQAGLGVFPACPRT